MERKCLACGRNFETGKSTQLYCGCSRSCAVCGHLFVITSKAPDRKYCSGACSGIAFKQARLVEKICPTCGKKWQTIASSQQVYCSQTCSAEKQKRRIINKCRYCGKEIETIPGENKQFCNKRCYQESRKRQFDRRRCTKCGLVKALDKFPATNASWCKQCNNGACQIRLGTPKGRYKYSINEARRRGLEWEISFEEHINLLSKKCHYCDGLLNKRGVGLDRMDNNVGYILGNVVPCCRRCNMTKSNNFSYDEMIKLSIVIKEIDADRKLNYPAIDNL